MGTMVMTATSSLLLVMGRITGPSGVLGTLWVRGCTSADRRSSLRESLLHFWLLMAMLAVPAGHRELNTFFRSHWCCT
jgi:hypothetical protein